MASEKSIFGAKASRTRTYSDFSEDGAPAPLQATVSDAGEEPANPLEVEARSKRALNLLEDNTEVLESLQPASSTGLEKTAPAQPPEDNTESPKSLPSASSDTTLERTAPAQPRESLKPLPPGSNTTPSQSIFSDDLFLKALSHEVPNLAKSWVDEIRAGMTKLETEVLYRDDIKKVIEEALLTRLQSMELENNRDFPQEAWDNYSQHIRKVYKHDIVPFIFKQAKSLLDQEAKNGTREKNKASKSGEKKPEEKKPSDAEVKRREITRIINVRKRSGSYYEILGVNNTAQKNAILKAYKAKSLLVHPDKNNDEDAIACTQDLNDAREILTDDDKRKKYDSWLSKNPPPVEFESFGEEFHEGAYDGDDNSDDDDDNDTQYESDVDIPKPPEKVKEYHRRIQKQLHKFFGDLDTPPKKLQPLLGKVEASNTKIRAKNLTENISEDAYTVDQKTLLLLQYWQRKLVIESQVGINADRANSQITKLQIYYTKLAQESENQWPIEWRDIILNPVRRTIGISVDEPRANRQDKEAPPRRKDSSSDEAQSDVDMHESRNDDHMSHADGDGYGADEDMVDAEQAPAVRIVEELKPGYTIFGEKILGYRIVKGFNRFMNAEETRNMWFCIQGTGPNPLRYATASRIGLQAALEYHNLPESEKTIIPKVGEVEYRSRPVTALKRILGVTCTSSIAPIARPPNTLVWVELRDDPSPPKKARFMFRSDFRLWQGNHIADKLIDDFFVSIRIEPPWAHPGAPINDSSNYQPLKWPLPSSRQQLLPYRSNQSNSREWSRAQLPAPPGDAVADIKDMLKGFIELMLEKDEQREQRAERERQEMRLLLRR